MSGWKPEYVLPSPFTVLERLWTDMRHVRALDGRSASRCSGP